MGISAVARCAAASAVLVAALAASGASEAQTPPATSTGYIVTLQPGAVDVAKAAARQLGHVGVDAGPDLVFRSALQGYTASLTSAEATSLANLPGVAAVEPDGLVWLSDTQPNAPWGVDRIDQEDLPLSGTYTYTATGAGVTAYVIDSGVRATHADFGGRAVTGTDIVDGGAADDCLGHGTHVSSTIGGSTYGVAKRAKIVAVRVFGCQSTAPVSDVIAGVDWAVADHQPGQPAVANMSLSYTASAALDDAVQRLVADGVTVSVAAGNGFLGLFPLGACDWSPGRLPGAVTVAASDNADNLAAFSNRGNCVDLIAPGVNVLGAGHNDDAATATMSGTSMAAPHVAGAAAKLLQLNPGLTPAAVSDSLKQSATKGTIVGTGPCIFVVVCLFTETPNLLVRTNN
jgi:subtilisin family serine protease